MRPAPFAILVLMLTAWGLFTVHQRVLATRHGYMVRHLQEERRLLIDENRRFECEIATLTRPDRIVEEIRRHGLDLVDPATLTRPDPPRGSKDRAPRADATSSPEAAHR